MNAINGATGSSNSFTSDAVALISEPNSGDDLTIGSGFKAQSFRARDIGETMDPLVMVDHFVATEPTFGVHPHAGMSAVSLLFEDSEGLFHNRDSLGNDFDLQPGDLYWLSTGRGAVHDEHPRPNSRIHALQVFVNVPQAKRFEMPTSLLVRSEDMPVINTAEYRVKVTLGESNGVRGATSPSTPMTMLDGSIQPGGRFSHQTAAKRGIWAQSIQGSIDVVIDETARHLATGQAIAIKCDGSAKIILSNPARESVHFVLFDGAQIGEPFVQDGPFVMGSQQQIADIKAAYKAGKLGTIADNR
ncbi:MAG: pirin family protein [Rhodothermaceae bacterium]|nr:pirin family protein [Rhodothermaceae bacterium]